MPSAIFNIVKKELRIAYRQNVVFALGTFIVLLSGLSFYISYKTLSEQQLTIVTEKQEKREEWLNQGDKHPHIAAHFGTYVFKPSSLLSTFDNGIDVFMGTSIYLEAHYQHEFMFRPAQDKGTMARFGELSLAMVLRVLMPLFIIVLSFKSVSEERESGTLRLIFAQGISSRALVWGKVWANTLILLTIFLPVSLLASFSLLLTDPEGWLYFSPSRLLAFIFTYGIYLFLFIVISVFVSLYSKSSRTSLLKLLVLWLALTVLIPKTVANLGRTIYPLPSMHTFKSDIAQDIAEGIDGKTPRSVRIEKFEKETLEKYDVDSIHLLPLNFGGLSMQVGEEYGNTVYDIHWRKVHVIFDKQNRLFTYASFVNPYIAMQRLSMAFAGTDMYTALNFEKEVEHYRRDLIKKMNNDMAYNSRYGEFYDYTAGALLWEEVEDFTYKMPTTLDILKVYGWELLSLSSWLLIASAALGLAASRNRWQL